MKYSEEVTQAQLEACKLYRKFDDAQQQAIEDANLRKFMVSARRARAMATSGDYIPLPESSRWW